MSAKKPSAKIHFEASDFTLEVNCPCGHVGTRYPENMPTRRTVDCSGCGAVWLIPETITLAPYSGPAIDQGITPMIEYTHIDQCTSAFGWATISRGEVLAHPNIVDGRSVKAILYKAGDTTFTPRMVESWPRLPQEMKEDTAKILVRSLPNAPTAGVQESR